MSRGDKSGSGSRPIRPLRYGAVMVLILSVPVALSFLRYREMLEEMRGREPLDSLAQLVALEAVNWYSWILVIPLIDWTIRRTRAITTAARLRAGLTHLALLAGFSLFHGTAMYATARAVHSMEQAPLSRTLNAQMIPMVLLYALMAAGFGLAEGRRRSAAAAEGLRAEVAEARLEALRQQLNPHFLFNALNHIAVQLRSREVEPALNMLLALSDLLRRVLEERAQLIPLREELRMAEQYLEIERARFGDRLHAELTFDPRALDVAVPSLLLQPLVENAMRHGISTADGSCHMTVSAHLRDGRLRIDVRDQGPGAHPSAVEGASGIGLRNTRERLQYLYGSDHTMRLQPHPDGGLSIELDLPARGQRS